jgi:hypothetical protein
MVKLDIIQALLVSYEFIIQQAAESNDWGVRDILSEASTEGWITAVTGGPTADPAVWQNWKKCVEKILNKNVQHTENTGIRLMLTCEQALKTMCLFMEERYWDKNNDILLKEVVTEFDKYVQKLHLLSGTTFWTEWIQCAERATKSNEVFED